MLQPTQGALPVRKLVSQPPLQLLADFSSVAIRPITEPGANDGVWATDDREANVRPDVPVDGLVACGLADGFGASTVTEGSGETEPALI